MGNGVTHFPLAVGIVAIGENYDRATRCAIVFEIIDGSPHRIPDRGCTWNSLGVLRRSANHQPAVVAGRRYDFNPVYRAKEFRLIIREVLFDDDFAGKRQDRGSILVVAQNLLNKGAGGEFGSGKACFLRRTRVDQNCDRQRFAEKALARLKDLERMIQDMLTFLRGAPIASEPIPLRELVAELSQVMEPQMADKGVQLAVELKGVAAHVRGDRKALCGALLNLLENALQASPAGSAVTLAAGVESGRIAIRVSDQGKGMSPEVQRRLFQPFFTTRSEGTGLGLAIMRSVVDAHGGEVQVDSEPGRGTTFIVHLPYQPRAAEAAT